MPLAMFISSVLAPLSGELPKAEGAAQAVYFAMNISRDHGDARSYRYIHSPNSKQPAITVISTDGICAS